MVTLFAISSTQSALQGLIEDPPTDPASVFVLLLSFGLVGAVLWAGRGPKDSAGPDNPEDHTRSSGPGGHG